MSLIFLKGEQYRFRSWSTLKKENHGTAGQENIERKEVFGMKHIFTNRDRIGKCPCCEDNVYEDQLFVEQDEDVYHLSCLNKKVKEEQDSDGK